MHDQKWTTVFYLICLGFGMHLCCGDRAQQEVFCIIDTRDFKAVRYYTSMDGFSGNSENPNFSFWRGSQSYYLGSNNSKDGFLDPYNSYGHGLTILIFHDQDFDRMEDGWECLFFGSLAEKAYGDFDDDGVVNLLEHDFRSDPTDPSDAPLYF
jgi:hypothetical protein